MSFDPQRPWHVLEEVLAQATMPVVAALEISRTTNLRWAVSTPTTNGDAWQAHLTITAMAPVTGGWAAATRAGEPGRWVDLLAQAQQAAQGGTAASEGLALLDGQAQDGFAQPPDDGEELRVPTELVAAFSDRSIEVFGYLEQSTVTTYTATSSGWRWRDHDTESRLEVSAKSHGRTRSAWAGLAGQTVSELDVARAISDVQEQLGWQKRSIDVPATPTTVILSPSATADLMLEVWRNAVARDAAEGHSAFSGNGPAGTRLGQSLTPRDLTLMSDPSQPGLAAPHRLWTPWSSPGRSVFDTGADLPSVSWITGGTLTNLAATRRVAADLALPFVASPECLSLVDQGGHGGLAEVIARTERGLVVTSLWYIRDVDPQTMLVTGLTRDGVYQVVDGQIVGATGNYRFNDSPLGILERIVDAGQPQRCLPREWADYFTRTTMPPLVVADFGLSTPSIAV